MAAHAQFRLTRRPALKLTPSLATSLRVWLGLLAYLAVVNLFITFVGAGPENDPRAVLFSWPSIAIFGVLGAIGIVLADRTGFPSAWDPAIPLRERLWQPILIGIAFGTASAILDRYTGWTTLFSTLFSGQPFNAPFPGSPFFYAGGAILVEVLYRLLPIPLLLWLVSNVLLRGRYQTQVFWVLAVLLSLYEPVSQDLVALRVGTETAVAVNLTHGYFFNFAQAISFRRAGFLASIVMRISEYMVWHVIYGNFICAC
jgi:hypothetical protein